MKVRNLDCLNLVNIIVCNFLLTNSFPEFNLFKAIGLH